MESNRRQFLQTSTLLLATFAMPEMPHIPWPGFRTGKPKSWAVVQGQTDATSTNIIVCHPKLCPVLAEVVSPDGSPVFWRTTDYFATPGSDHGVTQLYIEGLKPNQDYVLKIFNQLGGIEQRIFRSLDVTKSSCRFAVVSCMNDSFDGDSQTMWQTLYREAPEFVIFLGDTCYSDEDNDDQDMAGYGRRYTFTRSRLSWFFMPRLIPSLATWDDHDFGANNADRDFPMKGFTTELFRSFWGGELLKSSYKTGYGVGSLFSAFGQRFFLMDDRSFRDLEGTKDGSHWGQEQKDWLLDEVSKSDSPCWLMNGSQFFGGYLAKESFEAHHARDFKDLLMRLSKLSAPVVFVSGDIHFSEIMKIEPELLGYDTYEFTSSSMHSPTFPGLHLREHNPRRIEGMADWRHQFMIFESKTKPDWEIRAESVLDRNRTAFSSAVTIKR